MTTTPPVMTPDGVWRYRRRLRALQACGYTPEWIATRLRTTPDLVRDWSRVKHATISTPMRKRIRCLYARIDAEGGRVLPSGPTPDAVTHLWATIAEWRDIDDPDEQARSSFTDRARLDYRQKVPVPPEVIDRIRSEIAAHHERSTVIGSATGTHCLTQGRATIAARLGMSPDSVGWILSGRRKVMAAGDLDRLRLRLGMLPEECAAA